MERASERSKPSEGRVLSHRASWAAGEWVAGAGSAGLLGQSGREMGRARGEEGEGLGQLAGWAAGPAGLIPGLGFLGFFLFLVFFLLFLSFPISIPFQTQLFEFKLKFEFKPYALNQIKLMHQHECTNMLNLK